MTTLEVLHQEKTISIDLDDQNTTFVCKQGETLTGKVEKDTHGSVVIAFRRTRRGWVLIDYTGEDTYVNGLRVADAKLVTDNEAIRFLDFQAYVISTRQEIVIAGSKLLDPEVSCPYCTYGFEIDQKVIYCPDCKTAHHLDCWDASDKGCANDLSCGYQKLLKEASK